MVWDPQLQSHSIHAAVRRLIELRRTVPALRRGSYETVFAFNRVFAYARTDEAERVLVVLNAGPARFDMAIPTGVEASATKLTDALTGRVFAVRDKAAQIAELPARSGLILRS
jgi:glycosidase